MINIPSNGSINTTQANALSWYLMNARMGLQTACSSSEITPLKKRLHNYVHLGIKCNQFLEAGTMVDDACNKLRGTYLSLVHSGLSPLSLNPSISIKTVVIPKALYGSELWSSMTPADLRKLEHSHRFCLKHMQGLPRRTPTNFTLSAINAVPLETVIDHKKLNFLGQLCNLPGIY